jgi:hypothetical protein
VTSIKDQATCGCCWTFSSTAYVESFNIIKNNITLDLSEEYILECTTNSTCAGGYVSYAMTLAQSGKLVCNVGVPNATTYPYLAANWGEVGRPSNGICGTNLLNAIPSGTVNIYNSMTDTAIKTKLMTSPIPVLIYADSGFMVYSSGTYS